MRYGLVCSLEPVPMDRPVAFQGPLETYASLVRDIGYDAIELHLRNPRQVDGQAIRETANRCGLTICALSTGLEYGLNGLSLISDDATVRQAAIERLREHIDLAAGLSDKQPCLVVIGTMRSNIPDQTRRAEYEAYHTSALLDLADYARQMDVQLVIESITRYISNYLNTVPETARFLRGLGQPNLKLHIDTHSMNIEDADLPAAVLAGASELGYVHFSDSNRRYPGGGNIDFKPIVKKLVDIGYDGIITSECLPIPDAETAARQGLEYMKAQETCVRVESWRDA